MIAPIVLEIKSIQDFIKYVLDHHIPPTTLVICLSKDAFLEAFQSNSNPPSRLLTTPTLRLLSTSSTMKLAFCSDITHLRAYLATYSNATSCRSPDSETALRLRGATPILAILSPIQLHRPTSAFSAQGLNRTFAIAVEAAIATESKLIIAEYIPESEPVLIAADETDMEVHQPSLNPWDEELSILNVTTKRLGDMSVGRTVKARAVAERWCTFEKLIDAEP